MTDYVPLHKRELSEITPEQWGIIHAYVKSDHFKAMDKEWKNRTSPYRDALHIEHMIKF